MYRFLLSRQWVILTLLGLVLIPVMIKLGFWQLHRHEDRVAHNKLIADSLNAPAVPVGTLTAPARAVPRDATWRTVTATGRYDTGHEVVVRQRTGADERVGYFVVTPLLTSDGKAVLVNRGWIPAGEDLTRFPKVPAAPGGEVTVTGRLRADETTGSSGIKDKKGLPDRQVMLINSAQTAKALSRPVLGGYIELTSSSPKGTGQPTPVAAPDHSGIGPHMAYAIQWWLFAAGVPAGWIVLVRRERRDRAEAEAKAKAAPAKTAPTSAPASAKATPASASASASASAKTASESAEAAADPAAADPAEAAPATDPAEPAGTDDRDIARTAAAPD
ncbi:SURF1 family protein [Streptomyces sp. XD-27]|uniref:SURF1 family cytochrome oxidase biogenesis protein n=1 Tax=Streptomyces sp. XD-27 TaxID=3062779 RepID=UPI0026F4587C|nr:SURF1 family protein [Streptomyces sp. XD-27]WKX69662.1 SURF1 family protein [Streptomyces sp. XD-27]